MTALSKNGLDQDNTYKTQAKANNMSLEKNKKITLNIGGMSCVNCAQSIEKALNGKEGVYSTTVNFATEKVTVEYNPEQLSLAGIKKTIQDVGYQIIEPEKTVQDAEGKERQRRIQRLKILLAASVALTIPIILLMWFTFCR